MVFLASSLALLAATSLTSAFPSSSPELGLPGLQSIKRQTVAPTNTSSELCDLDQSKPPGNLTLCGNATLFTTFRSKARFIAPEGWMNGELVF